MLPRWEDTIDRDRMSGEGTLRVSKPQPCGGRIPSHGKYVEGSLLYPEYAVLQMHCPGEEAHQRRPYDQLLVSCHPGRWNLLRMSYEPAIERCAQSILRENSFKWQVRFPMLARITCAYALMGQHGSS